MQSFTPRDTVLTTPKLLPRTEKLIDKLKTLSVNDTQKLMKVSPRLATVVVSMHQQLNSDDANCAAAITTFQGDVYGHLAAKSWGQEDLVHANKYLRIISGLYGSLRPLDGIQPYRLELGYRLHALGARNLYDFWAGDIASSLPRLRPIVNLLSDEYFRAIKSYIPGDVITPRFLTRRSSTERPRAIAIHAKQARGSLARWLILRRINDPQRMNEYAELGYHYNHELSDKKHPVFIKQQN